jgi:hypothetical protein
MNLTILKRVCFGNAREGPAIACVFVSPKQRQQRKFIGYYLIKSIRVITFSG